MSKLIFDMNDGDCLMQTSNKTAMDYHGNMIVRMSDHMAMDLNCGEVHCISTWNDMENDD